VADFAAWAAQSWFRPGFSIAGGDITPPNGTAWISRVFADWSWSGFNLGGPSALEQQLPWAFVLNSVVWLGGSAELAQRIWYTGLFAGAALAAVGLLRVVGVRPIGAAVGAISYVLSPWVIANASSNPVFLASLVILPALPAAVLAGARGVLGIRMAAVLVAVSAPMLGYVFQNPPMLGLVLTAFVTAPVAALWLYGPLAAWRSLLVIGLGLALMLALSAYWVVPSLFQLLGSLPSGLAPLSSWLWTEGRATLSNAFWLNTHWGWAHAEYFPFARAYDAPPLKLIKFGPALLAFAALAFSPSARRTSPDASRFLSLIHI